MCRPNDGKELSLSRQEKNCFRFSIKPTIATPADFHPIRHPLNHPFIIMLPIIVCFITGGHKSRAVLRTLRHYLHYEWMRRRLEDPSSVPARFHAALGDKAVPPNFRSVKG